MAQAPAATGRGFFGRYPPAMNPALGPAYFPGLPSPLNFVEPQVGGWFQLGDGSVANNATEVERLYAEQQRRMQGKDAPEPRAYARAENRLRDGEIPLASQLKKGERELDPTCHPNGSWELDPGYSFYPQRTQDYDAQITHARGVDYVVRNPGEKPVKFDGCAVWDPRHELLEAKGPGYAALLDRAWRSTFGKLVEGALYGQGDRQVRAAQGQPIDWYFAEEPAKARLKTVIPKPIELQYTPAR
ncbi:hypothetical protein [Phenylobacterium sp.]|uniref:hypothetical protein n=1 Tax=Phenylobacterium sp. TaxID=1871053 RepID=UPI0025E5BAEF|nr:hypothetical protein [Phenylobacterium sp.]